MRQVPAAAPRPAHCPPLPQSPGSLCNSRQEGGLWGRSHSAQLAHNSHLAHCLPRPVFFTAAKQEGGEAGPSSSTKASPSSAAGGEVQEAPVCGLCHEDVEDGVWPTCG